jgi:hypothetical protein
VFMRDWRLMKVCDAVAIANPFRCSRFSNHPAFIERDDRIR